MKKLILATIFAVAATMALLLLQFGSAEAAGLANYGVLPNPSNPMSFSNVIAETSIATNDTATTLSGTLTTTTSATISFTVTVPAQTFNGAADSYELVVTTCGSPSQIGNAGYVGYSAYACFGVAVYDTTTNTPYEGALNPSLIFNLTGAIIQPPAANLLVEANPNTGSWQTVTGNVSGAVNLNIGNDPDFALLVQNATTSTTTGSVSGATSPQTGKPFLGEEVGAGIIGITAVAGALVLYRTKRKK